MIGLIAQAAGAAFQVGASMVPNKEFVEKTSSYTPNMASFGDAGLFNNVIGDSGKVDTYSIQTENNERREGLMGIGTMLQGVSKIPNLDATKVKSVDNRYPGPPEPPKDNIFKRWFTKKP